MQYMVADIIKSIDMSKPESFYIGRERIVMVQNTPLKANLKKRTLDNIREGKEVPKEEATEWILNNIVGKISKTDLDLERVKEINTLDMMSNSSFTYHTESLIEAAAL